MFNKAERDALAERVISFYCDSGAFDSNVTWQHFKPEGIPKTTFYRIIQRYNDEKKVKTNSPPGRPVKIMTPKVLSAVQNLYTDNPSITETEAAKKMKLTESTLGHIKRKKLKMKSRVKITKPKATQEQQNRSIKNSGKLYRKLYRKKGTVLIIDDETYVPADPSQVPGRHFFTCSDPENVPIEHKIKQKSKFPKRFLVWQAIDEFGNVSRPFITESTMKSDIYIKHCLKSILSKFIKKYHPNSPVLFWPDMATVHYAKPVMQWLAENDIDFVEKDENCPNLPQARPIEKFWALCKAEYAKEKNTASNLEEFKKTWTKISKKVARRSGLNLMKGVRSKLLKISQNGVFSVK
uniref:Tc1-like transposase DDE domain-containing protein n=1 Tax=Tetranychus urticae TaxID=32264 RepID=A0A158P5B2_TETUR